MFNANGDPTVPGELALGNVAEEEKKKGKRGRPRNQSATLTAEEVNALMSLPNKRTKQGARDFAVLLIFGNTPARIQEVINLNVGDLVDEGSRQYVVRRGIKKRSKKPYWIATRISKPVYDGIKKYVDWEGKRGPDEPLLMTLGIHGPFGKQRLTKKAVYKMFERYLEIAFQKGLIEKKRITPHSFRATYTTLRKHHDPWTLQALGGWNDVKSVMPYVREDKKLMDDAALEFQFAGSR